MDVKSLTSRYHLIIPSLPGYAFSSAPPIDKEFGMEDIGKCYGELMNLLFSFSKGQNLISFFIAIIAFTKEKQIGEIQSVFQENLCSIVLTEILVTLVDIKGKVAM